MHYCLPLQSFSADSMIFSLSFNNNLFLKSCFVGLIYTWAIPWLCQVWGSQIKQLKCWIPNPGVPCSKLLAGSKVDSAIHPSGVDKMSTRNLWEVSDKKYLLKVVLALRQLKPISKKGP